MKNENVVILCPMDCEIQLLLSKLSKIRERHIGGYIIYEGKIRELPVVLIRCLVGCVNAAVCTAYAIEHYSPRCIILQGTSGAHDFSYNINDIIIAEKIVPLSSIISPKRKIGEGTNPFEWEEFGVQSYSKKDDSLNFSNAFFCDKELVNLAKKVPYDKGKVAVGTVGCGDVWNKEADLIEFYHKTKGTDCEAMEGIGVAQICSAFDVPMIEIRVISNNELHENDSFLSETAESCQSFVLDMLKNF